MIKKLLVKLVFEFYVAFGSILKKIIPISWRGKIKYYLNKNVKATNKKYINMEKLTNLLPGINLIGYVKAEMGLGHGCRLLANAIDISGIDWLAINYEKLNGVRYGDETWSHKIDTEPKFNVNIVHINPDNLYLANMYLNKDIWRVPYSIGFYLWELEDIPDEWLEGFEFFDEIWAPSQFVVDAVKKKTNKPVLRVPYGISIDNYDKYTREHFGLPNDTFLFLAMYDINSTAERKNPMGAILAFKEAFLPEDEKVGIVIKINNVPSFKSEEVASLKSMLAEYKNVYIIEGTLNRDEVCSLIYCCDCFVSLHRAEGFGLVPAEAMYVGRPVISTDWSSTVDFVNSENACPVSYSFVHLKNDHGPYKKGQRWAEPNIKHAAEYMKLLYLDKKYYIMIANNGQKFIKENYTHENCANIIRTRLHELDLL